MTVNRQYVWSIADFVRKRLDLTTPLTIEKLTEATRKSGGRCIAIDDPSSIDGDFDAYIRTFDGQSKDRFEIVYAKWKPEPRILFSIAHELGHFFLHLLEDENNIKEETVIYRDLQASDQEWEANEFAAELLMPREEFIKVCIEKSQECADKKTRDVDVNEVAHYFGVSTQAAVVRGQILRLW